MSVTLQATKRDGNAQATREAGRIPAIVYGPQMDPISISVENVAFEKAYQAAGDSTIVSLDVDGTTTEVLVQAIQIDPVKRNPTHVDFRQVVMGEEMEVTVSLNFVGVAPAEKALGGTLNKAKDSLTVRCLPKDLVDHIDINLEVLATFDDSISVADVALPAGLIAVDGETELVVKVTAPLSEEQLAKMEESATATVEDIEVEEKGKKEEEEAAAAE